MYGLGLINREDVATRGTISEHHKSLIQKNNGVNMMIKYMDKHIFKEFFLKTLNEISISQNVNLDGNLKFTVVPVIKNGRSLNSTDEYLQRTILNEDNLKGREFDFDTVTNMLSCRVPLCPILKQFYT